MVDYITEYLRVKNTKPQIAQNVKVISEKMRQIITKEVFITVKDHHRIQVLSCG